MTKLRISDDDLGKLIDGCWIGPEHVRAGIEEYGIDAPAVTVEELVTVIRQHVCAAVSHCDCDGDEQAAHAVLDLMRRRTVPAAPVEAVTARPEHVKCALTGMHDGDNGPIQETWCGRKTGGEWAFVDASHAALNARNGGSVTLCPECAAAIVSVLVTGSQLVDLSRVSDEEIHATVKRSSRGVADPGQVLRAWLIEKAG